MTGASLGRCAEPPPWLPMPIHRPSCCARCTGRATRPRADAWTRPEVRDRLHDLAAQLRTDETLVIPMGEGNLASPSRWRRQMKYRLWRVMRPATWRYDRLIADHAELTTSLAEKVMVLEAEVDRLQAELAPSARARDRPDERRAVRVAVLHPQTAFVRGGAETHAESLVRALQRRRPRRRPRADRGQVVSAAASSRTRWRCGGASTSPNRTA